MAQYFYIEILYICKEHALPIKNADNLNAIIIKCYYITIIEIDKEDIIHLYKYVSLISAKISSIKQLAKKRIKT